MKTKRRVAVPVTDVPPVVGVPDHYRLVYSHAVNVTAPRLDNRSLNGYATPNFNRLNRNVNGREFTILNSGNGNVTLRDAGNLPITH